MWNRSHPAIQRRKAFLAFIASLAAVFFHQTAASGADPESKALTVNWYHEARVLQPVIDEFIKDTGTPVVVTDDYDTFTTDVILVSDYKNLTEAKKFKRFRKLNSDYATKHVPARWRDRDGYWVGIALRTRAVIYNTELVAEEDAPKSWSDFASPEWRGKVKLRAGDNVYNRSLLAWMIYHHGEAKARAWAEGVLRNKPVDAPFEGDTANAESVSAGEYALSLINTYYLNYMEGPWAEYFDADPTKNIGIAWMDHDGRGQHVNVTGAAINKETEKEEDARRLIEWLVSEKGQALLSAHVFKYPVRSDVEPAAAIKAHGEFKMDLTDLNDLEYHYDQADRILREVGWRQEW